MEPYVEMVKSSALKLEIASAQGFCALRLYYYTGSDPKAS